MNTLGKVLVVGVCLVGSVAASAQVCTPPPTTPDYDTMLAGCTRQIDDLINQQRERVVIWVMGQSGTAELYMSYRSTGGTLSFRDFSAYIAAGFCDPRGFPDYSWDTGSFGRPSSRPSTDYDAPWYSRPSNEFFGPYQHVPDARTGPPTDLMSGAQPAR